ncbi:CsbD family protein [Thalassospira sp. HF15]|uniref:CsbD family protein n=1 Tax=Thalassospira sp. HF15 TaxID=2722755 RepID=UPI001430224D|nr:CsbD family protein [Thalassospira sp. HF15]NIY74735.1 CsbD family protein [Thalassospira sp. HF15]
MNWDQIEGRWKQLTGDVKKQWGRLTDDDVDAIDGQQDKLVGRIQEAYGIEREEADRQVREWFNSL